ncbi:hypothetical protein L1765_07225 [Microaerobacter geothermalis]|uniref:isoprenylcysteine carboxyl methyltransferase family protein n=1 Tax=Microaerobacter geothermalis TaxID=674972 RepID=UPI001F2C63AA|nr:isoprenylcysteine carboxylmethyltransferase family protein [Microaerobacter geothermalis]MCF6093770.1 hypothetical protein [Microaerobacter geothermalis]
MTFFLIMMGIVTLQRIAEIKIANQNKEMMFSKGGFEVGKEHYKYIVWLHIFFFAAMIGEAVWFGVYPPVWWTLPLVIFILAQGLRYWCIRSLGPFWNTRIIVLPGSQPICSGPYRFFRHPNYLVVSIELFTLPLIFGLYIPALLFPILNGLLLTMVRIPIEEKALNEVSEKIPSSTKVN